MKIYCSAFSSVPSINELTCLFSTLPAREALLSKACVSCYHKHVADTLKVSIADELSREISQLRQERRRHFRWLLGFQILSWLSIWGTLLTFLLHR